MSKRACKNCDFWDAVNNGSYEGNCKWNAPQPVESNSNGGYFLRWPRTRKDEWCGRFVEKKEMVVKRGLFGRWQLTLDQKD